MSQPYGPDWEESPEAPPVSSRPRRRLALLAAVLLLLAAGGAGAYLYFRPGPSISTIAVARGDIRATITANAHVRASRTARLAFPLSGQIARVLVQEGDSVHAGDVLAELQTDDLERRLHQYELALAARQLDLDRAQAAPRQEELDLAEANVKKAALTLGLAQDNAKKNPSAANDAAREMAQLDYDIAKANLDRLTRGPSAQELQALRLAVSSAQIDLDNARAAREQARLVAPFDGVVTEVNAQPNELLGAYNPLVGLADITQLELLAEIDEIDVRGVAAGQAVEVHFDALPAEPTTGRVIQVFPVSSIERGANIYRARISFDLRAGVRPGMGATCRIATVEKKNVLLAPTRAIKAAGTQKVVTVLVEGARRNLVVETGVSDGNWTEIVSGLQPGALVVIE